MSPRAWLFVGGMVLGVVLLVWEELEREQPDRGVLPFLQRVRQTYRVLRGRA